MVQCHQESILIAAAHTFTQLVAIAVCKALQR